MEFTKDDYVVEGNLSVTVTFLDGKTNSGDADKVIIKGNWVIAEDTSGVSVFNRENIGGLDIEFKEG